MRIYTIGFTQKSAEQFFTVLRDVGIRRLLDVRLNNVSQIAGFAKRSDLAYFLRELCDAEYSHETLLAPTQAMLDDYKKHGGTWEQYETRFRSLMADRRIEAVFRPESFELPTALLCSELSAECCHRRLVLEHLQEKWGALEAVHLH